MEGVVLMYLRIVSYYYLWCIGHCLSLCECTDLWLKTDGLLIVVFLFEWPGLIWCSS